MMARYFRMIGAAVLVLAVSGAAIGCAAPVQYTRVELRGTFPKEDSTPDDPIFLARGETATIDNPRIVAKLASFFPGLSTGRKSFWGLLAIRNLELEFSNEAGQHITVYTKYYTSWGSDVDQGDLSVDGDLQSYLEALFTEVKVKPAPQPKG
jgi:hypothetical protein